MINTSSKWKEYARNCHVFHVRGTLVNGVTLNLTDSDFMMGTVKVTDAVSGSSTFDIGAVITNTFECTLNNFDGKFEGFDFDGATLTIEFGIIFDDETEEWIQRGIYRVDKPESLGSTIQIKAFDNMDKLNRYFAGFQPTFPISARNLVRGMCDYCGVGYSSLWNVANPTINAFDYNESTTCRQVLNWVCQIIGCYARVARNGNLTVKWYSLTWDVGDSIDGGTINPWEVVDAYNGGSMSPWAVVADIDGGEYGEVDWTASQVKSLTVGIDRITITGVRAYAYNTVDQFQFAEAGNSGYIIKLENNPLITADNMDAVANRVNDVVGNMRIQPFKGTIYGDPSMVAGDSIAFQDYRGRQYTSYITNFTFSISGTCEVSLGAQTPNEKELEFSNPTTGVIQGATRAAYDYISVRKLDGDVINAHTLNIDAFDNTSRAEVDTANGQITTISGGGISVHEEGNDSEAVNIKGDGVHIIKDTKDVAQFGSSVRIGESDKAHQVQTNSGVEYISISQNQVGKVFFGGTTEGVKAISSADAMIGSTSVSGSCNLSSENPTCNGALIVSGYVQLTQGTAEETVTLPDFEFQFEEGTTQTADISFASDSLHVEITPNPTNERVDYVMSTTDFDFRVVKFDLIFNAIDDFPPRMAYGEGTEATSDNQTVVGKYNAPDYNNTQLFTVGDGDVQDRSNAFMVDSDGDAHIHNDLYIGCEGDSSGGTRVLPYFVSDESFSAVNVPTNTATEINSFTISKGKWLMQIVVSFDDNGTGYRRVWLSDTSAGSALGLRYQTALNAISGIPTVVQLVVPIVVTTATRDFHIVASQNSGSQRTATLRVAVIGNAE